MTKTGSILSIYMDNYLFLRDSRAQKTVKGFESFTAVRGFNCSGKSTMIKAAKFGLGGGSTDETGRVCLCLQGTTDPVLFERKRFDEEEFLIDSENVSKEEYMKRLKEFKLSPADFGLLFPPNDWAGLIISESIIEFLENANDGGVCRKREEAVRKLYTQLMRLKSTKAKDKKQLKELGKQLASLANERKENLDHFLGEVEKAATEIFQLIRGSRSSSIAFKNDENNRNEWDVLLTDDSGQMDAHCHSGGQKKMASLAIYLAVASLKKLPFIILDDCDKHIHEHAAKTMSEGLKIVSQKFQIVVTCNDEFIGEAGKLVKI